MQVKFLTPLVVERGERSWTLRSQFAVEVDGEVFSVPPGFVTDFASVPRLPVAYYLAAGRGVKAAVLQVVSQFRSLQPPTVRNSGVTACLARSWLGNFYLQGRACISVLWRRQRARMLLNPRAGDDDSNWDAWALAKH